MKQDDVYKTIEADQFFDRNQYDYDQLPIKKRSLIDSHREILMNEKIDAIFEAGCHIGDLLNYAKETFDASAAFGVEPSRKAVELGKHKFPGLTLLNGVIADQVVTTLPQVDLVIVNDVFCWISRETIFNSIANLDQVLSLGGRLLIRDFLPDKFTENRNKHVLDHEVFCYKVPGSHGKIFIDSGKYKLASSRVFMGSELSLSKQTYADCLEDRWVEMVLTKVR